MAVERMTSIEPSKSQFVEGPKPLDRVVVPVTLDGTTLKDFWFCPDKNYPFGKILLSPEDQVLLKYKCGADRIYAGILVEGVEFIAMEPNLDVLLDEEPEVLEKFFEELKEEELEEEELEEEEEEEKGEKPNEPETKPVSV